MQKSCLAAVIAATLSVSASAQQLKPEAQVKLRTSAYSLMNYNLSILDAMASGKRALNKDEAVRAAEMLAMLSTVPKGFFGEGTGGEPTRAKAEIWTNRADFDARMDKMVNEAAKLPAAARTGDAGALKKAVHDVDAACSACHDEYRQKRR
jgi:cytochrome c556